MWIGSVYLSMGSPAQLKALFKHIYEQIPSYEWRFLLLAGDFNFNLTNEQSKNTLLRTLTKQFGLILERVNVKTSIKGEPDFLIHGTAIQVKLLSVNKAPSNHQLIMWNVELPCPEFHSRVKIPNRKYAEAITHNAWLKASNTGEFLKEIKFWTDIRPKNITLTLKLKAYKKPMIQKLLEADAECDALEIIRNYYKEFNQNLEDQRFSNLSREFFKYIKKAFKYDQIDKRDGSIISAINDEKDIIITDLKEVNKQLMVTMKELQLNLMEPQPKDLQFPNFPDKTVSEMKDILSKLYHGKAIAWDGVTDAIFRKEWKDRSAMIFKDLWSSLNKLPNKHFESRLIPLNKVFPKIPNRKDMRPIVVTSPLVKLIESGISIELTDYLIRKLHRSQTGFVPGNGIFVNINRAISRIKSRTLNKQRCYGVFVDFSSAYNTLNHQILFDKLPKVIGEEKTRLIRAMYSKIKIRLGEETFIPNQGVAQGSVISPALFNIYAESLFQTLEVQVQIDMEDLLGYADDTLILCNSLEEVTKVINTIRTWSLENNMKLNEKKSGLVEFVGRRMRTKLKQERYEGFPVCKEYKYLGAMFSNKLTMGSQLDYIRNKSKSLYQKLSPFLYNADLDIKKSMWQVLIQPLIEFALPLYHWETANYNRKRADSIIRSTFKLFAGLKVNTEDEIVDLLSGYNFEQRASLIHKISSEKWTFRKKGLKYQYKDLPQETKILLHTGKVNTCKRMPNELVQYLNITKSMCPKCKTPNSFHHLKEKHGCPLPNLRELLQMASPVQKARMSRREGVNKLRDLLRPFIYKLRRCVDSLK